MNTSDLSDKYGDELAYCELSFLKLGKRRWLGGLITTVSCFEDNSILKAEIGRPGDGGVLVVDGGASLKTALVGGHLAKLAAANGWGGLVINGAVRDRAEISEVDIAIFCLGTSPRRSAKAGAGQRQAIVTFGNITFGPGQHLYADDDGVLVSNSQLAL